MKHFGQRENIENAVNALLTGCVGYKMVPLSWATGVHLKQSIAGWLGIVSGFGCLFTNAQKWSFTRMVCVEMRPSPSYRAHSSPKSWIIWIAQPDGKRQLWTVFVNSQMGALLCINFCWVFVSSISFPIFMRGNGQSTARVFIQMFECVNDCWCYCINFNWTQVEY